MQFVKNKCSHFQHPNKTWEISDLNHQSINGLLFCEIIYFNLLNFQGFHLKNIVYKHFHGFQQRFTQTWFKRYFSWPMNSMEITVLILNSHPYWAYCAQTFYFYFPEFCPRGYFSADGLKPCTPCPRHYHQASTGQTTCTECPSFQVTLATNATSLSDCIDGRKIISYTKMILVYTI